MSGEIPMPSAPTEEAVKLARDFIDHHNGERMRAYREEADAMKRDLARRVDALVEAKVREALDLVCSCKNRDCECDAPHDDEIVIARVMGKEAT